MDLVFQWIKNIAFYLIIFTAIMNCVSNKAYKKYITFFSGILLVVVVISPFKNLAGENEWMDYFFELEGLKMDFNSYKTDLDRINIDEDARMMEAYKEEIKNQITYVVTKNGLKVRDIELTIDEDKNSDYYYVPKKIIIRASYNDDGFVDEKINSQIITKEAATIKESLNRLYQLGGENVEVFIS